MPKDVTVLVCRKCSGRKPLVAYLREHTEATVKEVGCQKICTQPVAAVRIDGTLTWFGGLKGGKRRKAFGALVVAADGSRPKLPKVLRQAAAVGRKRSGR